MIAPVRQADGGVRIDVHVIPRASRAGLAGARDGRLVVRVTAPPVDDAANEAVRTLIARVLDVPKGAVTITQGASSRRKTLEVRGVTLDRAADALVAGG